MAVITPDVHSDGSGAAEHEPHSDLVYWKVGGFLAALTALEVSTYWWDENAFTSAALIIMMLIKFVTVALYFMHLKFDAKILQRVFFAGLILAGGVYLAALGAMVFFDNSGTEVYNDPPRSKPLPPPATDPPPIIREIHKPH